MATKPSSLFLWDFLAHGIWPPFRNPRALPLSKPVPTASHGHSVRWWTSAATRAGTCQRGQWRDPFLGGANCQSNGLRLSGANLDDQLKRNDEILACVKHFALYGAGEAGRDYNTVDMSRNRMFNEYMYPYEAAVEAGVGSVMASFNEIDGVPATANKWLMTDVLRKQWGFNGFVVTDFTGISEMIEHGIGDLQTVSARALNAGIDMDMVSEGFAGTPQEVRHVGQGEYENPRRSLLPPHPRSQA